MWCSKQARDSQRGTDAGTAVSSTWALGEQGVKRCRSGEIAL